MSNSSVSHVMAGLNAAYDEFALILIYTVYQCFKQDITLPCMVFLTISWMIGNVDTFGNLDNNKNNKQFLFFLTFFHLHILKRNFI